MRMNTLLREANYAFLIILRISMSDNISIREELSSVYDVLFSARPNQAYIEEKMDRVKAIIKKAHKENKKVAIITFNKDCDESGGVIKFIG